MKAASDGNTYEDSDHPDFIFRSGDVVTWSATYPDLKLLYISPSSGNILGIAPRKLLNTNNLWYRYVHPDDLHIVNDDLKQRKGEVSAEYRILRPDGSICWVRESSAVIYDQDNVPSHVEGIIIDITRAKKAEDELHRSEERYLQAYNLMQGVIESPEEIAICALDKEYRYLAFNKNCHMLMEQV